MQHDAARMKGSATTDEPYAQPMRPAARGQIARNPSTDQKRQRRQQMRKSAGWTPGHMSCGSCGYVGHPRLGDTGAECGHCGSYSVKSTKPTMPQDNSRYLTPEESAATQPQDAHEDAQRERRVASAYEPGSVSDECLDDGQGCDGGDCDCGCHKGGMTTNEDVAAYHADDPHSYYKLLRDQHGDWDEHHERRQGSKTARGEKCRMCSNTVDDSSGLCDPCQTKNAKAKTATILDTQAWMLNPGDQIKTPNGKTQKVVRVRPHETSANHVYVDTDGGTAIAGRNDPFQVAPKNSQQQSLPGYGVPGGNSNTLPGDPQTSGNNAAPSTSCPQCGGPGTLARQGDHYTCSRCGYREQFGGAGGKAFSDSPSVVRTFSTINTPFKTAVARRAAALLNQPEETP